MITPFLHLDIHTRCDPAHGHTATRTCAVSPKVVPARLYSAALISTNDTNVPSTPKLCVCACVCVCVFRAGDASVLKERGRCCYQAVQGWQASPSPS